MADKKKPMNLKQLRQAFGRPETTFWDTSVPFVNDLWGGGLPSGKYVELHSDAGLGKTTLTLVIAKAMIEKYGLKVCFMDVEQALNESLIEGVGLAPYLDDDPDMPSFLILTPNKYSEVEATVDFLFTKGYRIMILDSLTNVVPDRRAEGSIMDIQPGMKSSLQAIFLEQYKAQLSRSGTTMILINQLRTKINFIRTTVEPAGGKALQFNTDIRTGMRRVKWLERGTGTDKQKYGIQIEMTTIKNKLTFPFRTSRIDIHFGKGVDLLATFEELLLERGIIEQSGAFFKVPWKDKALRGREGLHEYIKENVVELRKLVGDTTSLAKDDDTGQSIEELAMGESANLGEDLSDG